ncbi:hypothetical protein [Moraxella equi]|uniref:Uncharacterized protein n=1 Tax=Moraxella equi TaxID=60442 RepID=A0A378QMA4_9GAMM|nr:hypothetical protein [Moraxella equi]OPH36296.1 hypothetical protein B5J93_09565 [Moraxella equi]STZ02026.1 Uncharacterised protein [Moraxella equi]
MPKYQYDGEHHRVSIEGIALIKGMTVDLSDGDEAFLLNSGFGKAMLANGELVKVDETAPKPKAEPKPKTAESP